MQLFGTSMFFFASAIMMEERMTWIVICNMVVAVAIKLLCNKISHFHAHRGIFDALIESMPKLCNLYNNDNLRVFYPISRRLFDAPKTGASCTSPKISAVVPSCAKPSLKLLHIYSSTLAATAYAPHSL